MQKFLCRRRESSAAASLGSSGSSSFPALPQPTEGCSGAPRAPKQEAEASRGSLHPPHQEPTLSKRSRVQETANHRRCSPAVPRWYLALRTARSKAGLRLCRGPARQPGSSGEARPAAALCPALPSRLPSGPAAPTYSSGSRASAEVPGRCSAAHGRPAGLCGSAVPRRASTVPGEHSAGRSWCRGGRRAAEGGGRWGRGMEEWKSSCCYCWHAGRSSAPAAERRSGIWVGGRRKALCEACE